MLIITREPSESFTIGTNIKIVVMSIRNGKVRIGIDAPREIAVVRDDAVEVEQHKE